MFDDRTDVTFNTKAAATKVCRRLRDYSVLSRVVGRTLWVEVPTGRTASWCFDLATKVHRESGHG